jgi:hypothetical protein
VPDHISLWGSLLKFRREFDQYANLRPVRLMPGVPCPLAGRKVGDIDFFVVRENTEGEYSSIGGVMYEGTERETVIQESIFYPPWHRPHLKFAFELAHETGPKKHLTVATKSNGIAISMPWWDERFAEMARATPRYAPTSFTSTSSPLTSCASRAGSTWWWPPTCSATSSRTWARPAPAPSVSHPRPTSIRSAMLPFAVRAGAWLGAGHLRQGHRQSHRA